MVLDVCFGKHFGSNSSSVHCDLPSVLMGSPSQAKLLYGPCPAQAAPRWATSAPGGSPKQPRSMPECTLGECMRLRNNPNGLWGNACGIWGNTRETHGGIQCGFTYIPPWVFAHRMWKTYSKTTVWGNAAVWEIKSLKGGTTLFPQDSPNT